MSSTTFTALSNAEPINNVEQNATDTVGIWKDKKIITDVVETTIEDSATKQFQWHIEMVYPKFSINSLRFTAEASSKKIARSAASQLVINAFEGLINETTDVKPALDSIQLQAILSWEHTTKGKAIFEKASIHLDLLKELAQIWADGKEKVVLLSIDIEMWEKGCRDMLEIGIAHASPPSNGKVSAKEEKNGIGSDHYIIEDNLHLKNGEQVPDNRDKFQYGISEEIALAEVSKVMKEHVKVIAADSDRIVLVGHSVHGDVAWLQNIGVDLKGMEMLDVVEVWKAKSKLQHNTSLEKMLVQYGLAVDFLHNGGDDAYLTLQLLLELFRESLGMGDE
jgi:hypothetical protein